MLRYSLPPYLMTRPKLLKQRLCSTFLGSENQRIIFPLVMKVGIVFPQDVSPREAILEVLERSGFKSGEQLRDIFQIPPSPLICRSFHDCDDSDFPHLLSASNQEILYQALLLGLCGYSFYHPEHPVIWTNHSLSRWLGLYEYELGNFYGDEEENEREAFSGNSSGND